MVFPFGEKNVEQTIHYNQKKNSCYLRDMWEWNSPSPSITLPAGLQCMYTYVTESSVPNQKHQMNP